MINLSKIVKNLIQGTLGIYGYRLSRIPEAIVTPETDIGQIVNAYYNGHCLKVFMKSCIGQFILSGKGWDNQLKSILDKYLSGQEGDIIEIGANIGASLIPIAGHYPLLTFHCVEPVPEFFALLQENKKSFKADNVKVYNIAMGTEVSGEIKIHIQGGRDGGTAGALPSYDDHKLIRSINLSTQTIDSMFVDLNVKMIKLDVDGFEYPILQGATQILSEKKPMLFLEFHTKLIRQMKMDPYDLLRLLQEIGFTQMAIWDNFGSWIGDTQSFDELMNIANSVPFYVDVLFKA